MPRTASIDSAIAAIIASEIKAALAPYRNIMARMTNQLAQTPAKRGPGRPAKAAAPATMPVRKKRRWGAAIKAAQRAAARFTEGQKVSFNVGRGKCEGKVLSIDAKRGFLVLERLQNGQRVTRPAAKVSAAG